jgi:hypothetical protein
VLQILKGFVPVNFKLVAIKTQLKRTVALKFGATGVNVRGEEETANAVYDFHM